MNKKIVGLALVLSFFAPFSIPAFAAGHFTDIFMTDSNGGTTSKSTFGWNEKPWLYLKLPSSGLNVSSAWWHSPKTKYYFTSTEPNDNQERWLSISNWDDVKAVGPWHVDASYFYADNPTDPIGKGRVNFVVSPEPISSALFLLGGVALVGFRKLRKKRKNFAA